ncbi:MAG: large ribosomal subunit protein bL35 [Chloroflexota bacterium]|nr:MAG: 50S ribosomal protein L35 [Chloroflexota bacterium]
MPKIKTHKATAKRIKITGTGKIMIGRGFQNHKKAAKSKRSLRKMDDMSPAGRGVARRIRRLVPGLSPKK